MSKPKRQHPIVIVAASGKRFKSMFIPLIGLVAFGGHASEKIIASLAISAIAIIFIIFTGIISWFRFTYRMENDELRIEYGILFKTKKYIPLERIQSIDISEGLLQRMLGLVKVQIETAGGTRSSEPEAVLTAISKKEARVIQEFVTSAKKADFQREEEEAGEKTAIVYQITMTELVLLSLTSGGVGVIISGGIAFMSRLDDYVHLSKIFGGFEKWAVGNVVVITFLVFFGFVVIWVVALIVTMMKYANFTVRKTDRDLIIFHGLLERRQITIPIKRIQAIRINESFVRQMFGLATVYIESAGGSRVNEEDAKVTLFPIVKMKEISSLLGSALQDYTVNHSFHHVPNRARWRYILRSLYVTAPIVILSLIFLKLWGLLSFIILAVGTVWALTKHRDAGWYLNGQQLSLRFRSLTRTTLIMKKNRIQSLKMYEGYFQRMQGLASIKAFVKSGIGPAIGEVSDLEQTDIEAIYRWYSPSGK